MTTDSYMVAVFIWGRSSTYSSDERMRYGDGAQQTTPGISVPGINRPGIDQPGMQHPCTEVGK